MTCPRCGTEMEFNRYQGPLGGYKCPKCGLQIDKKSYYRKLVEILKLKK